jgi:hypothetical protein
MTEREKSLLELLYDKPMGIVEVMRVHRYGKRLIECLFKNQMLLVKDPGMRSMLLVTSPTGCKVIGKPITQGYENVREPMDASTGGKAAEVGLETAECDAVRLRGGVRGVESADTTAPITNA